MVAEQAHHQGLELVAAAPGPCPVACTATPPGCGRCCSTSPPTPSSSPPPARSSSGGRSTTRATPDGPVVRLAVADTGIGIAPEDQEQLFEAFSQVDDRTPPGPAAAPGWGSPSCVTLVTAMGGEIGVESRPGQGSTFWCRIPLALARRQQPIATRPTRALPGTRVLVVDDNASSTMRPARPAHGLGLERRPGRGRRGGARRAARRRHAAGSALPAGDHRPADARSWTASSLTAGPARPRSESRTSRCCC